MTDTRLKWRRLKGLNVEYDLICPQMVSGQSVSELTDQREIHESLVQALTSLPVSSLLDVDQISAALSQSTVSEPLPLYLSPDFSP